MHKSATKCNETLGKWCKNKHGASKIIDTLETYQYHQVLVEQHLGAASPPPSHQVDATSGLQIHLALIFGKHLQIAANMSSFESK
jgi:hypothetical protein